MSGNQVGKTEYTRTTFIDLANTLCSRIMYEAKYDAPF